jgi:hypothetical protein
VGSAYDCSPSVCSPWPGIYHDIHMPLGMTSK